MFTVRARNFLCFSDISLDLRNRGLCGVNGENHDEPWAGSNGSGKSSLLEALAWGLYGESIKGRNADDIVNLQAGADCHVTVEWGDYRIERYRAHRQEKNAVKFFIGGANRTAKTNKETQELIDQSLGLRFSSFVQACYFRQNTLVSFTAATDSEQKQIIEDILELGLLSDAQGWCRERIKDLDRQLSENEQALKSQGVIVANILATLASLEASAVEHLRRIAARRKSLQESLENTKAIIQNLFHSAETHEKKRLEEIAKLRIVMQTREAELTSLRNAGDRSAEIERELAEIKKLLATEDAANAKIQEAASRLNSLQLQLQQHDWRKTKIAETAQQRRNELNSYQIVKKCPTCGQTLSDEIVANKIKDLEVELVKLREQWTTTEQECKQIRQEIASQEPCLATMKSNQHDRLQFTQQIIALNNDLAQEKGRKQLISQLETNIKEIEKSITILEKDTVNPYLLQIPDYKKRIAELEHQLLEVDDSNPYEGPIQEQKRKLESANLAEAELKTMKCAVLESQRYYEYWETGFGNSRLKSYIMESIIDSLNERANHYARLLTNGDFRIEVSLLTTLKTGEQRERFSINVHCPSGVGYFQASGGEKRRIDMCILLALQDLVNARARNPIRILVLDECAENLDSVGVERMLDLLKSLAKERETLLYITHDDSLKILFPHNLTVVKEGGISTIRGVRE